MLGKFVFGGGPVCLGCAVSVQYGRMFKEALLSEQPGLYSGLGLDDELLQPGGVSKGLQNVRGIWRNSDGCVGDGRVLLSRVSFLF